jgi:hypothetical protein
MHMAANNHDHDVPTMDYAEHEKTFSLFAGMIKWGSVLTVAFLLITAAITSLIPWSFALIASALTAGIVAKFF